MNEGGDTRRRSAALFGNEKVVEVVKAVDDLGPAVTAQELANALGIAHSMVRDVLRRLERAGLLRALPRTGGSRSALFYEPADARGWSKLRGLAEWAVSASHTTSTSA